jgi:molecular chaperone GrpE
MDDERDWMTTTQPGEPAENESVSANEGGAGAAARTPPPDWAEAYEKALAEKKDLYDRLLRKQAELENFRKRTQKEKDDLRQYAAEDLVRSLLPTLDGFERALQRRDEGVPPAFYQGLELIYRELREVLGRAGLTPLETAGQLFDPYLHQAVETVNAPGRREHEIVEELQRGYKLKNKLLRPAIVKVAVGGNPGQDNSDK